MKQLPNIVSIFRTLLTIGIAIFVFNFPADISILQCSFWLTILVIALDGLDGVLARALKADSDFGAFFDIACDRIVELIYISLFAILRWIPFWILIVFLVRGILVDGMRSIAAKEGKTAFGEKSMMKSNPGYFLTSSRFMRASYGAVKAIAFAFMFLAHSTMPQYLNIEIFLIYLMTFYCVIRGIPVLIEGRRYFST